MEYDTEKFILKISEETSIWNTKSKEYYDKSAKHLSWMKVAKAVLKNFDHFEQTKKEELILELKKKWKNIKDTYRKKFLTKSAQNDSKIKKYVYFDILEFLRPTMEIEYTDDTFENDDNSSINENLIYVKEKEQPFIKVENPVDTLNTYNFGEITPKLGTSESKKCVVNTETPNFESLFINLPEKRQKLFSEDDADQYFLLSLLPKFKSLTENQKITVQIDILNIFRKIKNL